MSIVNSLSRHGPFLSTVTSSRRKIREPDFQFFSENVGYFLQHKKADILFAVFQPGYDTLGSAVFFARSAWVR